MASNKQKNGTDVIASPHTFTAEEFTPHQSMQRMEYPISTEKDAPQSWTTGLPFRSFTEKPRTLAQHMIEGKTPQEIAILQKGLENNTMLNQTHMDRFDRDRSNDAESWASWATGLGLGAGAAGAALALAKKMPKGPLSGVKFGDGMKPTLIGGAAGLAGNFAMDLATQDSDGTRKSRIREFARKKYGLDVNEKEAAMLLAGSKDLYDDPNVGGFYGINFPWLGFHGTRNVVSAIGDFMNPFAAVGARGIQNRQMSVGYEAMDEMLADRYNSNRTRDGMRNHVMNVYGMPKSKGGEYGLSPEEVMAKFPDLFSDASDEKRYQDPTQSGGSWEVKPADIPAPMRTNRNL